MTYCFANKFNYEQTIRETSIHGQTTSSESVADWFSYCREVCEAALDYKYQNQPPLGGWADDIIEIDETKVCNLT
jgi:hypothetical protein